MNDILKFINYKIDNSRISLCRRCIYSSHTDNVDKVANREDDKNFKHVFICMQPLFIDQQMCLVLCEYSYKCDNFILNEYN